eukprot:6779273-Pyramimonas_sp.AAC.1
MGELKFPVMRRLNKVAMVTCTVSVSHPIIRRYECLSVALLLKVRRRWRGFRFAAPPAIGSHT